MAKNRFPDPKHADHITVKISGEQWTIEFRTRRTMPKKTWGICFRFDKVIYVRKDLSPKNFLDTLIHEIRHAQHAVMFEAEEFINSTSTEIADAIITTQGRK